MPSEILEGRASDVLVLEPAHSFDQEVHLILVFDLEVACLGVQVLGDKVFAFLLSLAQLL